ncbi:carbohydrate ABC transporter permease [Roseateles sp.]|uniref:carbohydrate ABC transporter permease n=1 Tax=Roseateles sp. TaxID=1971397 RepID=UPI0025EC5B6E|nr:carbohydrate ABC transporter permease [Roseateles sp.]MBV8036567.1 carbohydrate ABC transporter permease [Roseateles sp.]
MNSKLSWAPRALLYGLVLVVFAGPFWAFLMTALSGVTVAPGRLLWWPEQPTLENFRYAWVEAKVWRYLLNSTVVVLVGTVLQLSVSALAAYALARKRFRGLALVSFLILSTMMLPDEVIAIPLFIVLGQLPLAGVSLHDTHLGMILPVVGWGFSIFMLSEFMRAIPADLEEAARVDGASDWQIFWHVILPLCKPALGSAAVFGFIMIWDQYLLPLLVTNDESLYTLPVALATVRADETMKPAVFIAISVIAMLPSILVYLGLQKSFNRGLLAGAVKG